MYEYLESMLIMMVSLLLQISQVMTYLRTIEKWPHILTMLGGLYVLQGIAGEGGEANSNSNICYIS